MKSLINNYLLNSAKALESLIAEEVKIEMIAEKIFTCYKNSNKVLVGGNGGLCAEAEHFCGELTCTFKSPHRKAISAISLTSSASAITAWSNDFGFDSYFVRMVEAHGRPGDLLFLFSTGGGDIENGYSMSLYNAAKYAKNNDIKIISIVGKSGGALKEISDDLIHIKSNITSTIQESTLVLTHLFCEILEYKMNDA